MKRKHAKYLHPKNIEDAQKRARFHRDKPLKSSSRNLPLSDLVTQAKDLETVYHYGHCSLATLILGVALPTQPSLEAHILSKLPTLEHFRALKERIDTLPSPYVLGIFEETHRPCNLVDSLDWKAPWITDNHLNPFLWWVKTTLYLCLKRTTPLIDDVIRYICGFINLHFLEGYAIQRRRLYVGIFVSE